MAPSLGNLGPVSVGPRTALAPPALGRFLGPNLDRSSFSQRGRHALSVIGTARREIRNHSAFFYSRTRISVLYTTLGTTVRNVRLKVRCKEKEAFFLVRLVFSHFDTVILIFSFGFYELPGTLLLWFLTNLLAWTGFPFLRFLLSTCCLPCSSFCLLSIVRSHSPSSKTDVCTCWQQ